MSKSEDAVSRDAHANDPKLAKALTTQLKHGRELVAEDIRELLVRWGMANGLTREEALQELQKPIGSADIVDLFKSANAIPDERLRDRQIARLTETTVRRILTRKQALQIAIRNTGMAVGRALGDVAEGHLEHTVLEASARTMFNIQKNVGTGFSFAQPNRPMVYSLVKKSRERIQQFGVATADRVYREVIGGVLAGHSVNRIAKEITDTEDDIWQAKRIVRTEVTAAASEGQSYALRSAGIDRYQYTATLDERTCPVCGALDQKVFGLDEKRAGENAPPMHPNCRCVIAAELDKDILKTLKGRTYRDPETGKTVSAGVPADMTYEEWKRQFIDKSEPVRTKMKTEPEKTVESTPLKDGTYYDKIVVKGGSPQMKTFGNFDSPDVIPEKHKAKYLKAMQSKMDNAPTVLKKAFTKAGSEINIVSNNAKGATPHFSRLDRGVTVTLSTDYAPKNGFEVQNQCFYHEIGHNMDWVLDKRNDGISASFRSEKFKNADGIGMSFEESLREEANAKIDEIMSTFDPATAYYWSPRWDHDLKDIVYDVKTSINPDDPSSVMIGKRKHFEKYFEGHPNHALSDISDMFDGATHGKWSLGWGHSSGYWVRKNTLGAEAFAEMTSATMTNPESLEMIKSVFPRSYEIYLEMLEKETRGM